MVSFGKGRMAGVKSGALHADSMAAATAAASPTPNKRLLIVPRRPSRTQNPCGGYLDSI